MTYLIQFQICGQWTAATSAPTFEAAYAAAEREARSYRRVRMREAEQRGRGGRGPHGVVHIVWKDGTPRMNSRRSLRESDHAEPS